MLAMDAVIYTTKISLEIRKESTRTTEILNLGTPLTGISTPGAEIISTDLLFLYSTDSIFLITLLSFPDFLLSLLLLILNKNLFYRIFSLVAIFFSDDL